MRRPQISVFIAMSLDGFIARKDGSIDWLDSVQRPGEDYGFREFFGTIDTLVVGRRTYEAALGFPEWPYGGKRCIVLSHSPSSSRHDEEFWSGEPMPIVERLAESDARHVYLDGGHTITRFLAARLVDDLTISIVPTLLGDGLRLFASGIVEHELVLTGCRSFESGLVQLKYQSARSTPAVSGR